MFAQFGLSRPPFEGPTTEVQKPSNAQSFFVLLPLDVPTKLFGEGWAVTFFEVCYKVEGAAYITHTTLAQGRSAVAADAAGEFVVAWTSYQQESASSGAGVFARRFDASGSPITGELAVNSYTTGDQKGVAVASDPLGNVAVVWWSVAQDGAGTGVYTQRFDASGAPIGVETPVNSFTSAY